MTTAKRTKMVRHFTKERSLQTDWRKNKEQVKHYELVTVFYYPLSPEALTYDDYIIRKLFKDKNLFGDDIANIDVNTKFRLVPGKDGKTRRDIRKIVVIKYGHQDKIGANLTVIDAHKAIVNLMGKHFGMITTRVIFVGTRGRYASTKARVLKKPKRSKLAIDRRGGVKE